MNKLSAQKAPQAIGPYSQGYEANGFLFTSGQIAIIPETGEIPEGIAAQAEGQEGVLHVHDAHFRSRRQRVLPCHQNNLFSCQYGRFCRVQ